MQRGGQRKLACQHCVLHFVEVYMQRYCKQVERGGTGRQCMVDRLLQIVHHIAGRLLFEQIAEGGVQSSQRIVDIAVFPCRQNGVAYWHKQLQSRLLSQDCLGINAPGITKQRRHQQ
ncbi:hypothetical protein D3C85_1328840 [compost metagenome]